MYGYQSFVETDKAGYVIRQRVASNLYDRMGCVHKNVSRTTTHLQPRSSAHSTRPFLSLVEKKWIAFQILNALRDALASSTRLKKNERSFIHCFTLLL